MSTSPNFCPWCGARPTPGARFCGDCGKPAAAPPPVQIAAPSAHQPPPSPGYTQTAAQPSPPAAPGGEVVLGVLPALQRRKGLFGAQLFTPIVTSHRLVFALLTSQMQQAAAAEARQDSQQQGKGFLRQWGAMLTSGSRLGQRYLSMPVNAILAENSDNFYLVHDQVQQVRLEASDPEEPNERDKVTFHTTGGKHNFSLAYGSLNDVRKALQPVYDKRVR